MAGPGNFLAMVLVNAKRKEARSLLLAVEGENARIEMLLPDGASQPLVAPPADVLLRILGSLEDGEREFSSSVYQVSVQEVAVTRGLDSVQARISAWSMGHCE